MYRGVTWSGDSGEWDAAMIQNSASALSDWTSRAEQQRPRIQLGIPTMPQPPLAMHSAYPPNAASHYPPAPSIMHASSSNGNGNIGIKRSADAVSSAHSASSSSPYASTLSQQQQQHNGDGTRKKQRMDFGDGQGGSMSPMQLGPGPSGDDSSSLMMMDDDEDQVLDSTPGPSSSANGSQKPKATRGSRACTVCRRLKMKCVGAENGPPCKRCIQGKHECIFEESNRGKRTSKKHEVLQKSLKKMEAQLETVMRQLKNPAIANVVAANGGIPGWIPPGGEDGANGVSGAGGGGDEEYGSPSESVRSLPDDAHPASATSQGPPRRPFYSGHDHSNASRQSYTANSPAGAGVDEDGYPSVVQQQQLIRNTETLTSHSPGHHPSQSPRPGSAMDPPMAHVRGSGPSPLFSRPSIPPYARSPSSYQTNASIAAAAAAASLPITHTPSSSSSHHHGRLSPKVPTLPDNALNPLGLLAEASLANRRASTRRSAQEMAERLVDQAYHGELNDDGEPTGGSASAAGTPSVRSGGTGGGGLPPSSSSAAANGDAAPGQGASQASGAAGQEEDSKDGVANRGETPARSSSSAAREVRKVGVANETYFRPGPINILPLRRLFIERQLQPEMLSFVSTEEVLDLFNIYFKYMNMHCSLLVQEFHTPSLVCSRSPFLLTVICAIASKFYTERPDLHPRLNRIAKKLSFSVPERGFKSLEIVQAYLLLALWGCGPVERFEQDKTWLLLGLAIRMGTDLNLHRKGVGLPADGPRAEWRARERELRNRERTWILCYVLDRSASAQMGKPHSIIEDYIVRNTGTFFRLPEARPSDPGLAAYAELQRIISRSLDFLYSNTASHSGLHTDTDYLLVIKTIEQQLFGWQETWDVVNLARTAQIDYAPLPPEHYLYFQQMQRFYFNYSMLVVNSFGLQDALERSRLNVGHFFGRCYSSAMACCLIVRDELGPSGFLRYSPDSHFVLSSYAVLTLLKLIRPEFQTFMENEERTLNLVGDVANTLEQVAINSTHTPALYSTFLRAVVTARTAGPSQPGSPRPSTAGNGAAPPGAMELAQQMTMQHPGANAASSSSFPGSVATGHAQQGTGQGASPLDSALASNPAAGVFSDEHQYGDGALGLKMFPPNPTQGNGPAGPGGAPFLGPGTTTPGADLLWPTPAHGAGGTGELDLSAGMNFALPNAPGASHGGGLGGTDDFASLSMDHILNGGFWDNVLMPGYSNSGLEGLSGGFVYGSSGSGFITPRRSSPEPDASAGANAFGAMGNGK